MAMSPVLIKAQVSGSGTAVRTIGALAPGIRNMPEVGKSSVTFIRLVVNCWPFANINVIGPLPGKRSFSRKEVHGHAGNPSPAPPSNRMGRVDVLIGPVLSCCPPTNNVALAKVRGWAVTPTVLKMTL